MVKEGKTGHHGSILNSAIIAISEDSFETYLPSIHIDTWTAILTRTNGPNNDHSERLEFIGDALMYLCIALELYDRYPHATPGFMTEIRQPLVTNLVLSLLAEKIDRRTARKGSILRPVFELRQRKAQEMTQVKGQISKDAVKVAADAMEMVVGALYMERGLPAVRQWVSRTYDPLITASVKTYHEKCRTRGGPPPTASSSTNKKRRRDPEDDDDVTMLPTKRLRPLSPPRQRPPLHERVANYIIPTRRQSDLRRPEAIQQTVPPRRVFIDLTLDDSDLDVDMPGDATDISDAEDTSGSSGPIWIDLTQDNSDTNASRDRTAATPPVTKPSISVFVRNFGKKSTSFSANDDADDESDVVEGSSRPPARHKRSQSNQTTHWRRISSSAHSSTKETIDDTREKRHRTASSTSKRKKSRSPEEEQDSNSPDGPLVVTPLLPRQLELHGNDSSSNESTDVEATLDRFSDADKSNNNAG